MSLLLNFTYSVGISFYIVKKKKGRYHYDLSLQIPQCCPNVTDAAQQVPATQS